MIDSAAFKNHLPMISFLQPYHLAFCPQDPKLFCTGYYPDVQIVDPVTLETIISLCSHVNPDWISALHVLRPNKKLGTHPIDLISYFVEGGLKIFGLIRFSILDDVILATTISGTVKVWTINDQEYRERAPLHENESKQIKTKNVSTLVCCLYNNRTVLIVSDRAWEVSLH